MIEPMVFVIKAELAAMPIDFPGTEDDIDAIMSYRPAKVSGAVRSLRDRAKVAFSAGLSEWIAFRLSAHTDVSDTLCLIESLWAAAIDYRYARDIEPDEDYSTPALAALSHVKEDATATLRLCRDNRGSSIGAEGLAVLARHVTPKAKARKLNAWLTMLLGRLEEHYPLLDKKDRSSARMGPIVPREVIDPDREFDPSEATHLVQTFVRGLDPGKNRYLHSAQEMKELGFEGSPYFL